MISIAHLASTNDPKLHQSIIQALDLLIKLDMNKSTSHNSNHLHIFSTLPQEFNKTFSPPSDVLAELCHLIQLISEESFTCYTNFSSTNLSYHNNVVTLVNDEFCLAPYLYELCNFSYDKDIQFTEQQRNQIFNYYLSKSSSNTEIFWEQLYLVSLLILIRNTINSSFSKHHNQFISLLINLEKIEITNGPLLIFIQSSI